VSFEQLDAAMLKLGNYDWLVLTSANTVRVLAERSSALSIELAQPGSLKVAAVGEATAEAARRVGFGVTFVPASYVAESLVEGLARHVARQRILLVRGAIARDVIPDRLRDAGAHVDVVDAYLNIMPEAAPGQLKRALTERLDAATFTSSSSVTHLAEAAHWAGIAWPFAGGPAVSIGAITSRTLRDLGWEPAAEADPSDIPRLIAATVQLLRISPQL
jgi:uroporphyrinogen-III synthase/uroporphyrinogen III methyltransferase/synthase